MTLPRLVVPSFVQYIGAFLTMSCNLNCSFCINEPEQKGQRREYFSKPGAVRRRLSPKQWATAFSRLRCPPGLPITLQGGEPTVYRDSQSQQGFYDIFTALETDNPFDLLTNLQFDPAEFIARLAHCRQLFQRNAPYPAMRVSYHPIEMNRVYHGRGMEMIVEKALQLRSLGWPVCAEKAVSKLGVYMVAHPDNLPFERQARQLCRENDIPFELKEFLGPLGGDEYSGTYLYPFSTNYSGTKSISCECRTTELLIAPNGYIFRCHHDLYASDQVPLPLPPAGETHFPGWRNSLELASMPYPPVGHILDPDLALEHVFRPCSAYGKCIPCDTKVKNNRFQSLSDRGIAHTSVEIRGIELPRELVERMPDRSDLPAGTLVPATMPSARVTGGG